MEKAVYWQAKHLAARGVEVTLVTRPAERGAPGADAFPGRVVPVPYRAWPAGRHGRVLDRSLNYPSFAAAVGHVVAAEVRQGRVELVDAQGLSALGYGRLRHAEPALRAPLVMNPQGMEEHRTRGLKRLALARLRALSREAARLADRVVATDEATREDVPRLLGVDPAKVAVLPNGIDLEEVRSLTPADPTRAVLEQPSRESAARLADAFPVFLSVGRLEGYKGFSDVLEALLRLAAAGTLGPRWAWVVVGEGPQRRALHARARRVSSPVEAAPAPHSAIALAELVRQAIEERVLGAAAHLCFPGRVSEPLLHALYERADVFVHATRGEGSSLVTLEAMAHGLPVVATRAGGIPDKVVDGATGRLVPSGDVAGLAAALAELAQDAGQRRAWGEAGRARVAERFAWPALVEGTLRLYEALLREARA
jgi:glycosyltransferase involved in cell wall biosynthesis